MKWDSSLYDQKHSFVFKHGEEVLALLNPQRGERILDVGCGTGHLTKLIAPNPMFDSSQQADQLGGGSGLYSFSCPVSHHAGRGMFGVILVKGEIPPEARLDRP
jgi:hypothetical protein